MNMTTETMSLTERIKNANTKVLKLLNEDSGLDIVRAIDIDMQAKNEMESGSKQVDYALKDRIIAATSLERLGLSSGRRRTIETAAVSYDRAAKLAEQMGLIMPAIICRIRACKIYANLGESQENIDYASRHLLNMVDKYGSKQIKNGTINPRKIPFPPYRNYSAFESESGELK